MANNGMEKVLTFGALAVGAYFVYEWFFTTPAATTPAASTSSTPPAGSTSTSGSGSTGTEAAGSTTTAATPLNLAALYTALVAATRTVTDPAVNNSGGTTMANPDVFNWYFSQVMPNPPAGKTGAWPPDPTAVFPGIDRTQQMPITQYWAGMSAYLSQNFGMSGLGVFAGLGALVAGRGMGMYENVNGYQGWPEVAWPGGAGRPVQ